ncbi:hypothetical protein P9239_19330 [Caballeronia sp. LZ062]|uniref:hypothetical protein n=1 Tax=unclassified Caballeronia TaxID=2646786 RepID=UPI00285423AE|nr:MULTISPECIES: hypothetical protein [unclassified Caballeronia]MDR5855707.1 hypothetical protein [Caballeronia sp. LZ050]MDR5872505.1 hypothetical protein [Caballeronia sp. LZ062]
MSDANFPIVAKPITKGERALTGSGQGELLELSPFDLANANPLATRARYFNVSSTIPELIEVLPPDLVRQELANRCAEKSLTLSEAEPHIKIAALNAFFDGFSPIDEHVQFATSVTAAIVEHTKRKRSNPRYERFYYALPHVVNKSQPLPARKDYDLLEGRSFILKGVCSTGRAAFVKRLRAMYGPPISAEPDMPDAPPGIWYFPTLTVELEECESLEDVIESMRSTFVAEIQDPTFGQKAIFRALKGRDAKIAAIAACLLLNVGLFILDGADVEHIGCDFEGILAFAVKLKSYGIPVLLSCTDAFFRRASLGSSRTGKALNGTIVTLRPFKAPDELKGDVVFDDENSDLDFDEWTSYCVFFWLGGLFGDRSRPMPKGLPAWTYEICMGRIGWLAAGFKALHEKLVWCPDTVLTEVFVTSFFEEQLAYCQDARLALKAAQSNQTVNETDFTRFMDHFEANAAEQLKFLPTLAIAPRTRARR